GIINISLNIPAGQTFTTQVFYSGTPQLSPNVYHIGMIFNPNTVFTISDPDAARYWWPCYDHPWDKAIVHLRVTLRSDWKVAANGIRDAIVDNGDGTSTTFWTGQNPMTTYLVCVTCGPYVEITQNYGDLPIQNFVMQNQYNNALVDLANLPAMIDYFSQIFGPYPFEKYGNAVVAMSTYGAMEHQTMTTLGNYIITGTGAYELVIAHELAHQWFGDAVSFLTFADVWLSEGFATYSEHLWTDKTQGWQAACDYVASSYHQYYINWEGGSPETIYDPAFNSYFAPPSYEKAASVLHMLRLRLGDALFFQLLQTWFDTYKHGNAVTAEFQAMAEDISGQDLEQFFDQWIYNAGIPTLEYSVWSNPDWYQPLKIIAKTVSNTTTPFHIEVPFRFVSGTQADSLLVQANPSGQINYFDPALTPDSVLTPNHNHWTLLRGIYELKPVLAECLPSNSSVLLGWDRFLDDGSLNYNVYRRLLDSPDDWQLLNPEPLDELSFTDLSAQNGITYQYALAAVDPGGWVSRISEPLAATPVPFSFAENLLVVDETRDGNGANINPDDAMVDAFYDAALSPIPYTQWDVASLGLPPLLALGEYRLVLWHADDFSQNQLIDHLNTLGGYLIGGGKVIISGWKTPSVLAGHFLDRFGGNIDLIYDNSASLISAQSLAYGELMVDPDKVIAPWNGMLPYIYTFGNAADPIYTATMNPAAQGNGACAALRKTDTDTGSAFILFGFPIYFMQPAGVRAFLQNVIPELLDGTPNNDPAVPPLSASLKVFPNPFKASAHLQVSLPEKGPLCLTVFNLRGQAVRRIFAGDKSPRVHSFTFNGCDDNGAPLSNGIYLLRMDHAGKTLSRKISLIK
ncbi:MAG: M1 family aminopeptidase, partial [Candidatus Cloacimonetes bacterium]|nr:M1 family aminopeptidase [Candidatus Cloacimonadota bacterium]